MAPPAEASCHHFRSVLVPAWDRIESSVALGSTSLEPHGHPKKSHSSISQTFHPKLESQLTLEDTDNLLRKIREFDLT
jgi:hypothetical protein